MNNLEVKQEIEQTTALDPLANNNANVIAERLKNNDLIGQTIKNNLIAGINNDYSVIPGTQKPTLLIPGANKICQMFGLISNFTNLQEIAKGDKTLLRLKCELTTGTGLKISESYGCAVVDNTKRDDGWEYNRALKMAQKRAKVGAVVSVANLSKVFTQDMDDAPIGTTSYTSQSQSQSAFNGAKVSRNQAFELYDLADKKYHKGRKASLNLAINDFDKEANCEAGGEFKYVVRDYVRYVKLAKFLKEKQDAHEELNKAFETKEVKNTEQVEWWKE